MANPPAKAPWYKNKWLNTIIVPILIILAVGAGVSLAGLGLYQAATGVPVLWSTSSGPTSFLSTQSVSMPKGVGNTQGLNFSPPTATIAKGGKVTWTNNDNVAHTVTSTSVPSGASSFDSGNMNANATFAVTFTVDGTYQYNCKYHPWMTGTITVTG